MSKPKVYISVAVDTTGPHPGDHSIVRLGACVVGRPKEQQLGLNFNQLTVGILSEERFTGRDAVKRLLSLPDRDPRRQTLRFAQWIDGVVRYGDGFEPILVSGASITWQFVQWYMLFVFGNSPFGRDGTKDVTERLGTVLQVGGPHARAYELAVHLAHYLPYPGCR